MLRRNPHQGGQGAIEVTVVMTAVAVLIFGSVRVWSWTHQTMINRQEAYQETRKAAGRYTEVLVPATEGSYYGFTFGMPNPYHQEPLELFTPREDEGPFDPGIRGGIFICDAGRPIAEQIEELQAQQDALREAQERERDRIEQINEERGLKKLSDKYEEQCVPERLPVICEALEEAIQEIMDEMQPYRDEDQRLAEAITDLQEEISLLEGDLKETCPKSRIWH